MGFPVNAEFVQQAIAKGLIAADQLAPQFAETVKAKPLAKESPLPLSRISLAVRISPLRLASEANARGKLRDKIARKSAVKTAVKACLPEMQFQLPVTVTLTRLGGKRLDDDNLARSMKAVRDVVAEWLGVDDADPRIRWRYQSRPAYVMGCMITVRTRS
jgi:hypothetical protein